MILLDTHIWIWWVSDPARLWTSHAGILAAGAEPLALSAISCWEVAKLVEHQRLELNLPVGQWISAALARPGLQLVDLSPEIAVESTRLPPPFHRDPADQIIVATARVRGFRLMTQYQQILVYPGVQTVA